MSTTTATAATAATTATAAIKRSKLNKSQLKEFAASGIHQAYAELNFVNITKSNAPQLLGATTTQDELRKGTSLLGGWATSDLSIYKPKMPRLSQGKVVKYESVAKPSLLPVAHPEGTEIDESYTYYIEGSKKAVAVAQETKCRVYAFGGLSVGIALVDSLNAGEGKKRLILDNDNSIKAISVAVSLVSKLKGNWEIAIFSYFKGIDDALGNGVSFSEIKFVDIDDWCSNTVGYISGAGYTFKSPQFRKPCIPSATRLLEVLGEKGTGKSWLQRQLALDYLKQGRNVFAVTHRINLSRKLSKEIGIPYIDDESYGGGSTGLCIDSIQKVKLTDCTGAIFLVDEIVQVLDHLHNSDTLKYKRSAVYKRFQEILQYVRETSGLIVAADADFDNKSSRLLAELSGCTKEEVFLIRNTYTFEKGLCQFTKGIGKLTVKGESKLKNPSNVVAKLLKEAKAGKRLFCCLSAQKVDSKFSTQVIELFLIANGIPAEDILRIDSETIGDNTHPAFKAAERINELCADYRIILASPSLNTGMDIQYKYFDYILGIFSGTLDPNSVRQFLSRVRKWDVPRLFYAPAIRQNFEDICLSQKSEFELFTSAHTEALKLIDEQWFSELNEESREKLFTASKEFYLKQSWEKDRDKFDYLKRINLGLTKEGYDLEPYEDEITVSEATNIYNQLKDIQETLKETRLELTETHEIKSEEEAQRLYEQTSLTVEEKCGLKGYEIRRKFNLPPTPEVQKALEGQTVSALENQFAAFEGAEVSKVLWEKAQYWAQERKDAKETAHDFVKRNVRVLRIKALNKINFFNVVFDKFEKNAATELLAELRKDILNYKLFPSLPEQDSKQSIKAVKAIAQLFNLDIKQVGGKTNKGTRFYKAVDRGLLLSDSLEDVKPKVFDFWLQERKKKAEDWQAFKRDIYLVKRGEKLDGTKNLPPLSDDFKYTKLSTRARTMPLPIQPCYRMVDSDNLSDFKLWLASRPELAVDIETYGEGKKGGLNHIRGSIRLIQFADWGAIWILEQRDFDLVRREIQTMLKNPNQRKVGHNFMFDLRFLRKEFGVLAKNCADTMLGSRCLLGDMGAAQITSHSLQQSCENFLGIEVDKSEQKSDWGILELTPEQLSYAAKDPWLTFVLYKRLEALTKQPRLLLLPFPEMMAWEAWEVENRFLFAAQQMENTGYQIDMELLANTKAQYQAVRDELMGKWDAPFLPTQKAKLQQFLNEKYGLSLKSLGKAIAAENSDIPEIKLMQQICACDAILHTLFSIEIQVSLIGSVKPVFTVLSGTGRTSSGATGIEKCLINLQSLAARVNPVLKEFNLPALKALFKTDLIIDLPASHGRISAELGDDKNALAAYMDDSIDMHCGTAAAVAKAVFGDAVYTAEWIQENKKCNLIAKGLRDTAKNTYYGWLNGAGVATIQKQIKSNLQINADKSACQKALEGLQNVFSGTTNYAKDKLKELEENQFIINGVVCGWMEFADTYLCWKLGFVGGDLKVPATKAFAGIWSRTESLLMKRACYLIAEKFDEMPEWNSRLQNFIHDEINAEIGSKDAAIFAHTVVREEFGRICYRTISGFDPLEKCYPLKNWSDK
jgi:hypothetical protein